MFKPQDRVIVKRSDGTFESWLVLDTAANVALVGAEVPHPYGTAEATKTIPFVTLARWQAKYATQPITYRAATLHQIEGACHMAEAHACS